VGSSSQLQGMVFWLMCVEASRYPMVTAAAAAGHKTWPWHQGWLQFSRSRRHRQLRTELGWGLRWVAVDEKAE
jgi:hypothetical protein